MHGDDPDVANERNQKTGRLWWSKLAARTVIAAFVGLCFGWGACEPSFQAHRLIRQEAISAFDET